MSQYYNIANITIAVDSELPITDTTFGKKFQPFETDSPGDDLVSIHHRFQLPEVDEEDLGARVHYKPPWAIYRKNVSWLYAGITMTDSKDKIHQLGVFNDTHTRGDIYNGIAQLKAFKAGNLHALTMFPTDQVLLSRILADRGACFLHAAGLVVDGKGYLFVGHSDAGKTTITRQFQDQGATVLCDDRIIVRQWPDGFHIHGTWSHGDIPDVSGMGAPLEGIYFLSQADQNEVVPIPDTMDRMTRLLPCLIKALVTQDWWEKMFLLLERISAEVPCYVLNFDKSGEVVRKVLSVQF